MKHCSKIAYELNYDEINLNVGCPSKAVQKGSFGACLMTNKILVRNCLEKMLDTTNICVSVKCRIGIGKDYNYDFILANLNKQVILKLLPNIKKFQTNKPYIILSGLTKCHQKKKLHNGKRRKMRPILNDE